MKKYICLFEIIFIFLSSFTPISASSEDITGDEILKVIREIDGLTYQIGSKGKGVHELQNLLIAVGYSSIGKADGIYGNKTVLAIRDFQSEHNIPVTGKADLYTQFLLVMNKSSFIPKKNTYIAQTMNYAVIIWPDKAFYIGAIDNANLIEGTYYYSDGSYYAGEYKNNLRSGRGQAHFTNGDVYTGQWKNDAMNGYGTYYFSGVNSGEYYRGNMTGNMMNGKGTYYYRTNHYAMKITGKWSNNWYMGR